MKVISQKKVSSNNFWSEGISTISNRPSTKKYASRRRTIQIGISDTEKLPENTGGVFPVGLPMMVQQAFKNY